MKGISVPAVLVAYAVLHLGVRLLAPNAVEHDEAEQLLLSQSLAVAYGKHPPLYTWLQHGVFRLLGVGVLGLALLKHACLLGLYGGTYLTARRLGSDRGLAGLTALSLWLVPAVVWEAPRDLTHSVLAGALAPLSVHALVSLAAAPTAWRYAALGGVLGLGFLAKYNFGLFAGLLLATALSVSPFRATLLDRRTGLLLLAGAAVVGPHLAALAAQPGVPVAITGLRLGARSLDGTRLGLVRLLTDLIAFLGPLILVVGILVPAVRRPAPEPDPLRRATRQLLERYLVLLVAGLVLSVPLLGLRLFKARWLLPLLAVAPLTLFLRVPSGGPDGGATRRLSRVLVGAGLLAFALRLGEVSAGPWLGMPSRLHLPIAELAARIRSVGFRHGTIIAGDVPLGGNLRLHFPDSRVLTPSLGDLAVAAPRGPNQCMVAWRPRRPPGPPRPVLTLAAARLGRPLLSVDAPVIVEVPLPGPVSSRRYALGLLPVPAGPAPCDRAVVMAVPPGHPGAPSAPHRPAGS